MFAGHVGAALAIGRAERRVNMGVFVFAAVLLDFVLWLLVLLGWSALAGVATFLWYPRLGPPKGRAAVLVAAAVFSHWLLDALVHGPELPIAGAGSMKVGLGLWRTMPVALAVEALIAVAGLYFFVSGANLSRAKKLWLTVLSLLILAFTVVGMTVAPPPPSAIAMAASSLVTITVVCILACWLGKLPHENEPDRSEGIR